MLMVAIEAAEGVMVEQGGEAATVVAEDTMAEAVAMAVEDIVVVKEDMGSRAVCLR